MRNRPLKLARKIHQGFTLLTCLVVALQPMMVELAQAQEIIIDPNGNVGFKPSLQRTSRPQVVDIARPNAGGVSHNQYREFNVPDEGTVLNNSQGATSTHVAGAISGNPNLSGGTASTIVNEVTSTSSSTLTGSIEVAGDRAGVIIANPNGVLCNGCNFLNASNGTLTTGVPVIDGGNVRLDVTQGAVTIGRRGLDGSSTPNVNLIGRTVVVDGKVTAIDGINVQGGAQSYDLTNGRRLSTLTGTGAAPDFVVDGTEYGAMEAGRIQIIGNEQGLGVRTLGSVQSNAGGIQIAGQGDTTVRSVAAQGAVALDAGNGTLTLERDITSATSTVTAFALNDVATTARTGLYGFAGVSITAQTGELSFGGDLQSGADVTLYGGQRLTFAGYGTSTGGFTFSGETEIVIEGATIVANAVEAIEGGARLTLRDTAVFSREDFHIETGDFELGRDVTVAGLSDATPSKLVVTASGSFRNSADLRRHDFASISFGGDLYNEAGGIIEGVRLAILSDADIHNAGVISGTTSLTLDVASLFNNETGVILAKSGVINTSSALVNEGVISSDVKLTLTSEGSLHNDGYIQAHRAYLSAPDLNNSATGEIRVSDYGEITSEGVFANGGILASLGAFRIIAAGFENAGVVNVDNYFEVIAGHILNETTVIAGDRIVFRASEAIRNEGTLASYGNLYLSAGGAVINSGHLLADGTVDIGGASFDNASGALLRARKAGISTSILRNAGEVFLIDDFSNGSFALFENAGVFATQGRITLVGRDADAEARFLAGSALISGLGTGTDFGDDPDFTQEVDLTKSLRGLVTAAVSSSGNSRAKAASAIDGEVSRYNRAETGSGAEEWIEVDLASALVLTEIVLSNPSYNRAETNASLIGAEIVVYDATHQEVYRSAPITDAGDAEALNIALPENVEGRYVRLEHSGQSLYVSEVKVFGHLSSEALALYEAAPQSLKTREDIAISFANLLIEGRIAAGGDLSLSGPDHLLIDGQLQAGENLSLSAPVIEVTSVARMTAGGLGKLSAGDRFVNAGVLSLSGQLELGSGFGDFVNTGVVTASATANRFTLHNGSFVNEGVFQTLGNSIITAASFTNSGHLQAGGRLELTAERFAYESYLDRYGNERFGWVSQGAGDILNTGTLLSGGDTRLYAGSIRFDPDSYLGAAHLKVTADHFDNAGLVALSGEGSNTWTLTDSLLQTGTTYADGPLSVVAGRLEIGAGSLLASASRLSLGVEGTLLSSGALTGADVSLSAASIIGTGSSLVTGSDRVTIKATSTFEYAGELVSGGAMSVSADSFDLAGNTFGQVLSFKAATSGHTRGNVYASDGLSVVVTEAFTNAGFLEARSSLSLSATQIVNESLATLSGTSIDLRANAILTNAGRIAAANMINVNVGGTFTNAAGAEIEAVSMGLSADTFTNFGEIDAYGLFGRVNQSVNNYGAITTETYMGFDAAEFVNQSGGQLHSHGHLFIDAGAAGLTTRVNSRIIGESVDLRVGALSNAGLIDASSVLNIADVDGAIHNMSTGSLQGATIALLADGEFRNDGVIGDVLATDVLNISADLNAQNTGLATAKELRLLSRGQITNSGTLTASSFLGVKSRDAGIVNNGLMDGRDVLLEARTDLINHGSLRAEEDLVAELSGSITNAGSQANITARDVSLIARNDVLNEASLTATTSLALASVSGSITNRGQLEGADISLVAQRGTVVSHSAISGRDNVGIEASDIQLKQAVAAPNQIVLSATKSIELSGSASTKDLYVGAGGMLRANGGALRGWNLTQLIVGDIDRFDGNYASATKQRKLGIIGGPLHDVVVQIGANLGMAGTRTERWSGSGSYSFDGYKWVYDPKIFQGYGYSGYVFEHTDLAASGSVSIRAETINLSGKLIAGEDLLIRGGDSYHDGLEVSNATLQAGRDIFLTGSGKHFHAREDVEISPGNSLKIARLGNATAGSVNISEWLTSSDLYFDLEVYADYIGVHSSHRFVGHDITLLARHTIGQRNQVIVADKITYAAETGQVYVSFDPFQWRAANPNARATSSRWDVSTAGLRGETLVAGSGGISLYAGGDIRLTSGKFYSYSDIDLTAGNNIISEPLYRANTRGSGNVPGYVGWSFSDKYRDAGNWRPTSADNVERIVDGALHLTEEVRSSQLSNVEEYRAYTNQITARQNVNIIAGGHAAFLGTPIKAHYGDVTIEADEGISLAAAWGYREFSDEWSWSSSSWFTKRRYYRSVYQYDDIYTRPEISAARGDVSLRSEGDVIAAGAKITAGGDLTIASAQSNILLGTYRERYVRSAIYNKTSSFLGITYNKSKTSISIDAELGTGSEFQADSQLTLQAENDIRIIGGRFEANRVRLEAGRNLYIDGAIDAIRLEKFTQNTNLVTITTIQEGYDRETVAFPEIVSTQVPEFSVGGDVHIAGWRGVDINRSLARTISNRDFDNALANLYTPAALEGAQAAAGSIDAKYLRDYDLPGASDGQQFAYLDTLIQDYGATYHTIALRDREWYDKQVQLTPAFRALLQIAVTYATGGSGLGLFGSAGTSVGTSQTLFQIAAQQSFNSFTVSVIDGAITGQFDLGDALQTALIAGGTSYISGHLSNELGLSTTPTSIDQAGSLQAYFAPDAIVDRFGNRVLNQVVTNAVRGEDLFEGFDDLARTFLISETLAVAQFGIGELGHGNADWEGSFGHLLLHGGVGCVALEALNGNCAAGFASGASSSLLAGADNLSNDQKQALAPLVGAIAAFPFADGEATNVSFGSTIGESAINNNYLSHSELVQAQNDLRNCIQANGDCFEIAERYLALSARNDAAFAACDGNRRCEEYHLKRIVAADLSGQYADFVRLLGLSNARLTLSSFDAFQYGRAQEVASSHDWNRLQQLGQEQFRAEFVLTHCGGQDGTTCSTRFDNEIIRLEADAARRAANLEAMEDFVGELTSVILLAGGGGLVGVSVRQAVRGAVAFCGRNPTCIAMTLGREGAEVTLAEFAAGGAAVSQAGGSKLLDDVIEASADIVRLGRTTPNRIVSPPEVPVGHYDTIYPRGLGAANGPLPDGYVYVSRWVSPAEARLWLDNQGTAIPSAVGHVPGATTPRVFVTQQFDGGVPPGATGSIRIDFAAPEAMMHGGTGSNTGLDRVIFQPATSTPIHNVRIHVPDGVTIPN
ncbi:filamentous hemagglutinin N-terminal domain-containing protein [Pseudorhodobacter sp. E13]|uniref:two-partner secretion domain-containing protein n=1 Tax=Pseudorhodobacter sp. E13 TaxID=2487931 RepID=UPI0013158389|nr:filamentous hemagglutinin N-terminal domain-containing protein [Pseudorhodobacter sp. E13]